MSQYILTVFVFGAGIGPLFQPIVEVNGEFQGVSVLGYVQFMIPEDQPINLKVSHADWETQFRTMSPLKRDERIEIYLFAPGGSLDALVSTYNFIDIYRDRDTGTFYFRFGNIEYRGYGSLDLAIAGIDELKPPPLEPEPTPEPVPMPGPEPVPISDIISPAPSNLGWFQGVAEWFNGVIQWFNNGITGSLNGLGSAWKNYSDANVAAIDKQVAAAEAGNSKLDDIGGNVATAFGGMLKGLSDGLETVIQDSTKAALDEAITSSSQHSPDPEVKAKLEQLIAQLQENQKQIVEKIQHSQIDPAGAQDAANTLIVELVGGQLAVKVAALLIDLLHPIKNMGVLEIVSPMVDSVLSGASVNDIMNMHVQASIVPALRKHVNSLYTPAIPGFGELTNMRVKEKISQAEYQETLAYQGFNGYWAGKMWDAHFNAPTLNDVLTAWRRGQITEARVDELMTLIDLDPYYKQIFDTRKYIDPPLNMIRFMFETGNINAVQVGDLVHLQGYRPEHEGFVTQYITEFQSRLWRRRYLISLSQGYEKGLYNVDQLRAAVVAAEYTGEVADYIVKNADIRKQIAGSKTGMGAPKLLAIGDLKKAYSNNLLTVDQLRTELGVRGYATTEIDLLLEVMELDRREAEGGKRVVALTISEMKAAWRYGVWTEDKLSIELQNRGLSLDEVNTMIATEKAKLGVAEQQA